MIGNRHRDVKISCCFDHGKGAIELFGWEKEGEVRYKDAST